LGAVGFEIDDLGGNTISINGIPTEAENKGTVDLIESILEEYKLSHQELDSPLEEQIARSSAKTMALREGKVLEASEVKHLLSDLFSCKTPYNGICGQPTMFAMTEKEIADRFKFNRDELRPI